MGWFVIWILLACSVYPVAFGQVSAGNAEKGLEEVERVVAFSQQSRTFVDQLTVELKGGKKGEEIRYTLDGSVPGVDKARKNSPVLHAGWE